MFQYDGWPSGMEMPPTSMYGDHHARWGWYSQKKCISKIFSKKCLLTKSSFSGLPWTPWRLPTTRPQPSTWIIHPGRTPHPNCDKVAIPCQKSQKADHIATARPAGVSQVHDLDTLEFSALSARERKMPRSVKFIKGISPKNWLQSTSHSNSAPAAAWAFSKSEYFDCMCVVNSDSILGDRNLMVRLNLYSPLCFECGREQKSIFRWHRRKLANSIWKFCCSSLNVQTAIVHGM